MFSYDGRHYRVPEPSDIPNKETCASAPREPHTGGVNLRECILSDWAVARQRTGRPVGLALLRYLNVAGCEGTGMLGEHHDPEPHLMIPKCSGPCEVVRPR